MNLVAAGILAFEHVSPARSLLRGLLLFLLVFAIGAVWLYLKRRSAMRTIEHWAGTGIHEDLGPAEAALLIGAPPDVLVAAVLAPVLSEERARVISARPLRLEWAEGEPSTPLEVALAAALEGDAEGFHRLLQQLYERVNREMVEFSGRATAVHYRRRVMELRERMLTGKTIGSEEFAWLLLDDPAALWDRSPGGAEGEDLRQVVRYGALVRRALMADVAIQRAAHERRNDFWRYRRDLRRDRVALGAWILAGEDGEPRIDSGPVGQAAVGLARALDGTVKDDGASALIMGGGEAYGGSTGGGAGLGVRVEGRIDDGPVTVVFGDVGRLDILRPGPYPGALQLVRNSLLDRLDPFDRPVHASGDEEFDRTFVVRQSEEPGGPSWLASAKIRGRILALDDLERLEVRPDRLQAWFPYDRRRVRTGPVLERVRAIAALSTALGAGLAEPR